ncbi:MAG: RNA polymerase sigma factor [Phycisphaerales bacterium]
MAANNHCSTTTTQLLDLLKDESNQEVWMGFDARYRPIIEGVARRLGLPQEDAVDVAQETLAAFVRDYRRGMYERGQGRLRSWIMSIARHRAIDMLRARARTPGDASGDTALQAIATEEEAQAAWEVEEESAILNAACAELRETSGADPLTMRIFELTALHGLSNDAAAAECHVSVEHVRRAKHRMTSKLREILARVTDVYQSND